MKIIDFLLGNLESTARVAKERATLATRLLEISKNHDHDIDMVYECLSGIDVDIEEFAQVANSKLDDLECELADNFYF